jgi:hypothetical protein
MSEFPEGATVWRQHFSEQFPKEAIDRTETTELVNYGELLVYVIYNQKQGTDRRKIGFNPAESTDYSTQDPATYVPEEFQTAPGEIDFLDPFDLVSDDEALSEYDGWGDVPLTPTQTFATDVSAEPCELCEGAQVHCTNCADTGEADCTVTDCKNGIVKIPCGACAGTGRYDKECESCGGTGTQKKRCTQCNGTGEYLSDYGSNNIHTCRECDSNNMMEIDCDACSGGSAPSGKRNVRCDGCGGTGTRSEEQCSTCSQYPDTEVGTIPCPECDAGTNPPECVTCQGAGEQSVVHWVTREYNLDVEWLKLRRTEASNESDGSATRSLIGPPEFITEESELRPTSVESGQFFYDELSITDVELDVHPTRPHIQGIRHGVRSPPDAPQAEGTAPWVFSTVSDEDMSAFSTRYSLDKVQSDGDQSFAKFVENCEVNRVSGTDDDIIVPPTDPFVTVYYRLVSALEGTIIFKLEDLHEKHPDISKRAAEVAYSPTASVRETNDGGYEVYDSHAHDKVREAYESTGVIDRITDLF